mgnify:CR=1 FL=1
MRYQVELSHVKWKKCMQMQMAMHCAPVLAGLKPSNAVTLDYIDSKELIQSLAGSDIKCGLIYSGNGKCLWLLYREQQVNQYLMDPENQRFLKHCGYSSFQIQNILYTLKNRYRLYKAGQADFPHELGLILGYPLCDVIGFIKNNGQNCLYCRSLKFTIKFVFRWSNLWNTERVLKNSSTCTQIIRCLGMLN